jgi:putative transposase
VTVLGNIDAYQNAGIQHIVSLGHSRSPLWCGSQVLKPGYGRPLRNFKAPRAAITFRSASFPTCYGTEFTSNAILGFADRMGIDWHYIAP